MNEGLQLPLGSVIIANTKAQVALSGCRNFKCNDPLARVCWLSGGNRLHCLVVFGQGISILLKVWQWGGGVTLPAVLPFQRPHDFGHGVHRLVDCAGRGFVKALMHHQRWTKGRAWVWVQWCWDDIRVEIRTATAADCEQEKVGKKALRLEHGMRCSRASCGTPPFLVVVNMVGTRTFTCYMGAL